MKRFFLLSTYLICTWINTTKLYIYEIELSLSPILHLKKSCFSKYVQKSFISCASQWLPSKTNLILQNRLLSLLSARIFNSNNNFYTYLVSPERLWFLLSLLYLWNQSIVTRETAWFEHFRGFLPQLSYLRFFELDTCFSLNYL